jgi:hypothetical protein
MITAENEMPTGEVELMEKTGMKGSTGINKEPTSKPDTVVETFPRLAATTTNSKSRHQATNSSLSVHAASRET